MNTHDKIELPLMPAYETGFMGREAINTMRNYARAAIEPYAKRIAELEAARFAYASEFPPNEDGDPDVGSIHENIRKLKAEVVADRKRTTKQLAAYESLVASLEAKCTHMRKMYDELKARTNPDLLASERAANAILTAELEADRKRQGEVVVTKTPEGEIIAVTRQDNEGKILSVIAESDRKRRGEPVAHFYPWELERSLKAYPEGFPGAVAVYTAPQPADHSGAPTLHNANSGAQNGIQAPQPAEPEEKAYPVKMYAWGGVTRCHDYEMSDGSIQTLKDTEARELGWGRKPAEPVKVPSDSAIMWEWANTPNTGDMRIDLVVFARALLARYGRGTPSTEADELSAACFCGLADGKKSTNTLPAPKPDPHYEEGTTDVFDHAQRQAYVDGWNECLEAMGKGFKRT